jgi:glycopeptide antibiotics resistance protein
VLVPPWRVQEYNRSFWNDLFVNILGFIPFGFAVSAWARKDGERKNTTAMGIALLLGAGISLFIELLQVYLPTRDSSLTDVMNNVLGMYLGARLFRAPHGLLYR